MKGRVKVSGQTEYLNDATSPSTSSPHSFESNDRRYEDQPYPSTSSAVGTGQELIGKNDDDIYRLFLVPIS